MRACSLAFMLVDVSSVLITAPAAATHMQERCLTTPGCLGFVTNSPPTLTERRQCWLKKTFGASSQPGYKTYMPSESVLACS